MKRKDVVQSIANAASLRQSSVGFQLQFPQPKLPQSDGTRLDKKDKTR